jgi:hypothetical protein
MDWFEGRKTIFIYLCETQMREDGAAAEKVKSEVKIVAAVHGTTVMLVTGWISIHCA